MSPEAYIIAGIILGLLFTELTSLSPGGVIVPGYMALFLHRPAEIVLTVLAAAGVMLCMKLLSHLFFLFGRRRYAICLLLGVLLKVGIEHFFYGLVMPAFDNVHNMQLVGWLIPGIMANDMQKQGIPRTLLAAATVTAMVFLLAWGVGIAFN